MSRDGLARETVLALNWAEALSVLAIAALVASILGALP